MTTWKAVAGDLGDKRLIGLRGGVDSLVTATTVAGHVMRDGISHDLAGVVHDAANKVVEIDFSTGFLDQTDAHDASSDSPTLWKFEVQVLFGDGSDITWPARDEQPDTIRVRRSYG